MHMRIIKLDTLWFNWWLWTWSNRKM